MIGVAEGLALIWFVIATIVSAVTKATETRRPIMKCVAIGAGVSAAIIVLGSMLLLGLFLIGRSIP